MNYRSHFRKNFDGCSKAGLLANLCEKRHDYDLIQKFFLIRRHLDPLYLWPCPRFVHKFRIGGGLAKTFIQLGIDHFKDLPSHLRPLP
jgi:hypothetical protein